MVESTREHWKRFWETKIKEKLVYPSVSDISGEILFLTKKNISGKRILEVGCGSGRESIALWKSSGIVYLLDYVKSSLLLARSFLSESKEPYSNLYFIIGDGLKLPFFSNSFDIVFHQGLLEHFKNPYTLLSENYRVLKRGGILLVDVPQTFHPFTILKHLFMLLGKWFAGWEREFTPGILKKTIELAGFKVIRVYGYWMRPSIFYRLLREIFKRFGIYLPLYPKFLSQFTKKFYNLIDRVKEKKLFLYTYATIGVIAIKI